MKLLIVDDENLTRTGLKSSIDWMDLGIDEVILAEDGMDGLHKASIQKPEIVLSDVRMPRMTGIEMMDKLHDLLPDTVFIFMSGYSDKDYLKAAIRLQAIDYVEKPLNIQEVEEAVRTAIAKYSQIELTRHAATISETISASHLALCLTMPYRSQKNSIQELSQDYCRKYGSPDLFHAAVTLILAIDPRAELLPDFLPNIEKELHDAIRPRHMHVIAAEKKTNLFVFHVFRKESFTDNTTATICEILKGLLPADLNWYLTAGSIVSGLSRLYDSYSAAVISLQHCFFREPGTILLADTEIAGGMTGTDLEKHADEFRLTLKTADGPALHQICEHLYADVYHSTSMLTRTVQTVYYQLASALLEQRKARQLPGAGVLAASETSLNALNRCFSYPELHTYLVSLLDKFLEDLANYVPENSSVYLIKQYIHQHFDNPMLSTKEISEYASLSASYACTVFKNETGQTLNQYLTEYRLERAKELLADPRNNISDVAFRVGYNDSNYFGKAFKKYTGLSPSEFRERSE